LARLSLSGLLFITRISALRFNSTGFGEYQVARRTLAVIVFPLMCGIGISLPRYIARSLNRKEDIAAGLIGSTILGLGFQVLFTAFGIFRADDLGRMIFGSGDRTLLVRSLLMAVGGQFFHNMAYVVMRGLARYRSAAVLQVVNGVVVPLVGILRSNGSPTRALFIAAASWTILGVAAFVHFGLRWAHPIPPMHHVIRAMWRLAVFGFPRIPADVALFGLFALPSYAAVHRNDIVGAGLLSVGLSFIQGVASVFASAGFVLLPYWSRAVTEKEARRKARARMTLLLVFSGTFACAALVLLELSAKPAASFLLGPLAASDLGQIRVVMLGLIPYVTYLVLRDYFDAIATFPLNSLALTVAIAFEAALLFLSRFNVANATVGGFLALGVVMLVLWRVSERWS
jgi:O-antigen/teichoic acid export membrane protein